jgi:hypothetical protein
MSLGAPRPKSYSDRLAGQCGGEQTRRFSFLINANHAPDRKETRQVGLR